MRSFVVGIETRPVTFDGQKLPRRETRLERVEAEDAEAAARAVKSRCSVGSLAKGVHVVVYELTEVERWRFQYEYPDGSLLEGKPYGEAVGIRLFKTGGYHGR